VNGANNFEYLTISFSWITLVPLRYTQAMQVGGARKVMNDSNIRKSALASTGSGYQMRPAIGVRSAALCAALMFATLPFLVFAQTPCLGIHVKILNIRNSIGTVACALFESPDGFPFEYLRMATNVMVIKIRKSQALCDFDDILLGTYAMAVIHDENMNGNLNTNWLGVPTEGYGFSNDAKRLLGAPSFSPASFKYDGQNIDMTMSLQY
jgi:uncharacterized protein (DUF2141 family)